MKTLVADREKTTFHFRKPTKEDGAQVWELIKHTGNLDLNSSYSYLMWCDIFSETSIVAFELDDLTTPVGFVSGFINPENTESLFIWQVAVHESQRGKGLATKMLKELVNRESCKNVEYMEATVSPSNKASHHLFTGFARKQETEYEISDYFEPEDFPEDGEEMHEAERLYKIGPLAKKTIKG